jgi:UbiD family decarboxylase
VKELLWGITPQPDGPEPAPPPFAAYDPFAPPEPPGSLDLRGYIKVLTDARHVTRVKERVDWKLGIGRWTVARHRPLLFENVKDYQGQRVFTNGLIDPMCIALALELDDGLPAAQMVAQVRRRLRDPITPKVVRNGPVMENVVPASVLDLLQFPAPQWSEHDGGRYIGTWHLNISKDPETGQRSAGMYRMKVIGRKQATVNAAKHSELARHVAKAEQRRSELPMALAIGVPEATAIAARAACPEGMDVFDLAGALQQKPVKLMDCGHLEVPAYAEIIIEGFIDPRRRIEDGPMFDHEGKANTNAKAFLFEATRVMHRDNPIFRGSAMGRPGGEDYQVQAFLGQLKLLESQRSRIRQLMQNLFG